MVVVAYLPWAIRGCVTPSATARHRGFPAPFRSVAHDRSGGVLWRDYETGAEAVAVRGGRRRAVQAGADRKSAGLGDQRCGVACREAEQDAELVIGGLLAAKQKDADGGVDGEVRVTVSVTT